MSYWSLEETTIQDLEAKVFSQVWHTGCTYVQKYDNLLPPNKPVRSETGLSLHVIYLGLKSTSSRPMNAAPPAAPSNATVVNSFCVIVSTFFSLKSSRNASS